MPSLLQILVHTPLWVWALLALVIGLGVHGLRSSIVPPWRLWVWPFIGLASAATAFVQSPRPALAVSAWLVGVLAGLPVGYRVGTRRGMRRLEDGRIALEGSWFGLSFGLAIFVVRYAVGVVLGIAPGLGTVPLWIGLAAASSGAIAGVGFGWLAGHLLRDRASFLLAR